MIGRWVVGAMLVMGGAAAWAEAPAGDGRMLVEMPPQSVELLRQDMRRQVNVYNEVLGLVAEGKLDAAGELAEQQMGFSSMGHFRGNPWAPGLHMDPAMRSLARNLHKAASEFADATLTEELPGVLKALKRVGDGCVACHSSFRVR